MLLSLPPGEQSAPGKGKGMPLEKTSFPQGHFLTFLCPEASNFSQPSVTGGGCLFFPASNTVCPFVKRENEQPIKEPGEDHGNDQSVIRGLDTDRIMDRREALLSVNVNHRRGVTTV